MSSPINHTQSYLEGADRAYAAGDWQSALELADKVIEANPRNSDALHRRGLLALAMGSPAEAQHWLRRAVQLRPHPVYCNSLCVTQTRLGDYAAAAETARLGLRRARERFPAVDTSLLSYNLGVAQQLDDQPAAAAQSYRQTLARQRDHAAAHNNLGTVTKDLGDLATAIAHFERAIARDPRNVEAHSNLGHALLAAGRYEEAWPYFEQRWASFQVGERPAAQGAPTLPIPRWRSGPLPGERRLLVLHEQGFGDALQFCRYLPIALARGTRVGYICPRPLRQLLEQSLCTRWPNIVLLDEVPSDLGAWDAYCSLLSLPMLLGTRLDNIPAPIPYLHAEPQRARMWADRLRACGDDMKPRIGLVWAGGHTGTAADRRRSIAPDAFAKLLSWRGAHWISLQKAEDASKQLPSVYRVQITDWMHEAGDFADTAALIDGLDLVISVDTSVAHLAAAMGKPVWLLNRFAGCWRWLRDRDDSPWYPGLRLFTQKERGNWDDVLNRVLDALATRYSVNGNPITKA
ncbi:tetratricopeptide repeat-containing glycosyltransferase family protein [Paraburkholderia sp. J11-2]|uniref:tetratricopeptide repeat-containing glycosyltransferase family protein n=1 Tax=Paraburkholderia sp. J11-2 TaxID=2805431 RepID=UPI002AB6E2F4|nr:tetratricopeptide repeat-containing glycosyltransferase family protein [Paraburkholderia sp. J11-2]